MNGHEGYRNEMKSIHSYRNGVTFLAHSKVICIRDHTGDGLTQVLESVKSAKFFPEEINLYERKGLGGTPKDYLLGVHGRLQEGFRANLELHRMLRGIAMEKLYMPLK